MNSNKWLRNLPWNCGQAADQISQFDLSEKIFYFQSTLDLVLSSPQPGPGSRQFPVFPGSARVVSTWFPGKVGEVAEIACQSQARVIPSGGRGEDNYLNTAVIVQCYTGQTSPPLN